MTGIVYRRELYLAVLITCLERFESYFEISCSGFVFILWINFIFVTRLAQFFRLKKKSNQTKKKKRKQTQRKHYLKIKSIFGGKKRTTVFFEKSFLRLQTSKTFLETCGI